jgi:hypothetical protein
MSYGVEEPPPPAHGLYVDHPKSTAIRGGVKALDRTRRRQVRERQFHGLGRYADIDHGDNMETPHAVDVSEGLKRDAEDV